ncbi:hypothetical protein [Niabella ginsengisoli]|uniref:Uncharacterized protein n=1 Tax=Niabella ginsengisoli TaxID=522298 RepID=A0ABS9SR84_9BACT|nr:hypothetical protein [Niabella ginsengisoli]MCH5600895.1 hypothetical protein [Niabella ginsengisoli]
MSEKLDLLIEYYAEEMATLQQLMDKEIEIENNYLAASWYQQGFYKAKHQYDLLNSFKDSPFSEKERALKRIDEIKIKLENCEEGDPEHFKFSTLLSFAEEQYQTQILPASIEMENTQPDGLDQALKKLFNKEIKGFDLVINKRTNFRFKITRSVNKVFVTLPDINSLKKSGRLDDFDIRSLQQIGFVLKSKPLRLLNKFSLKNKEEINNIKTFLSRWYFSRFGFGIGQTLGYIEMY